MQNPTKTAKWAVIFGSVAMAGAFFLPRQHAEARTIQLDAPRQTLEIRLKPGEPAPTVVLSGWVCVEGTRDFPSPKAMVEHFRKGAIGRFDPRTPPGLMDRYMVQQYMTERFLGNPSAVIGKIRIRFLRAPKIRVDAPPGKKRTHVLRCVPESRFRTYFAEVRAALSGDLWQQWKQLEAFPIRERDGKVGTLDLTGGLERPPAEAPRGSRARPSAKKLTARQIRIIVVREARGAAAERGEPSEPAARDRRERRRPPE